MENLIPIVVKFPAESLLQINSARVRLFWAILDQPKVREMYWKGPREAAAILTNRNRIEAKIGKCNWKMVPSKVVENVKELAPKPCDGTGIEGFGDISIYLPIEKDAVYLNFYKTSNLLFIIIFIYKLKFAI